MSDDVKPNVLPGDLITGPGVYEARNGDIVQIVEHDGAWWVCECDGKRDWYHSDGSRRFKSTDSDQWKLVRWIGPLPADEPTTSEQIAEIEGQAEPQPVQVREGRWRTRNGEIRHVTPMPEARKKVFNQSRYSWYDAQHNQTWLPSGHYTLGGESQWDLREYLGPIEPEPEKIITPDDVAAEALAGVHDSAVVANPFQALRELKRKLETTEAALLEQQQQNERLVTHSSRQHIEIAELQAQVAFLKNRELTLGTRLEEEKAVTAKRLQQVEELRSEVSHVQGLLGESRQRVKELEQKLAESQTVVVQQQNLIQNRLTMDEATGAELEPQPVLQQVMIEAQAETIARLNSEIHSLNMEIGGLQAQLEAVKADLAQVSRDRYLLQIELDAREQVPEAVSDRFDQGFEQGTSRAVETIAEWTAPFRTCGSQALAYHVMQNLPHIMRSLTGLADED